MYAIEVNHSFKGWIKMQVRYREKTAARSWLSFVRSTWHGLPVRVVKVDAQTTVPADK